MTKLTTEEIKNLHPKTLVAWSNKSDPDHCGVYSASELYGNEHFNYSLHLEYKPDTNCGAIMSVTPAVGQRWQEDGTVDVYTLSHRSVSPGFTVWHAEGGTLSPHFPKGYTFRSHASHEWFAEREKELALARTLASSDAVVQP